MTVGRLTSDPAEARTTFRDLRATSERCRGRWPGLGPALSMGMSDDFELAIEEGATIVRVGRALFGERPHTHGAGSHTHAEGARGRLIRPRLVDSAHDPHGHGVPLRDGAPSENLSFSNVRFAVRLTPRSAVERVDDVVDGVLKVRVMAPAVDGAANAR